MIGKFKIGTAKNIWIYEIVSLRSKKYAFRCGDDGKSKLKGISKSPSKIIKFEQYKSCLDGEENENVFCNYIF